MMNISNEEFKALEYSPEGDLQNANFMNISWNIRGAINRNGRRHARELVINYNPSMVILQETHCQFKDDEIFWNGLCFQSCGIVEDTSQAGGIWVLGAIGSCFTTIVVDTFPQATSIKFVKGTHEWLCIVIYANHSLLRRQFDEAYVENLPKLHFDHSLLLVRCGGNGGRGSSNRPFRFQVAWSSHPDFYVVVNHAWSNANNIMIGGLAKVREDAMICTRMFVEIFSGGREESKPELEVSSSA
ncbi:hypothetical protein Lal_00014538 [Lupinus albus]|nr:hypothetical protein Lal_00014538 [Lupinus albus]